MGPCLCGDTCCPHCGDPAAEAEAGAHEELCSRLHEARLTADELLLFETVGMAAVEAARKLTQAAQAEREALEQEAAQALEGERLAAEWEQGEAERLAALNLETIDAPDRPDDGLGDPYEGFGYEDSVDLD